MSTLVRAFFRVRRHRWVTGDVARGTGPGQATRVQEETSEPTPTGIIALALHVWVLPIRFFFFFFYVARLHSSRDPYLIRRALRRIASSSMAGDGSRICLCWACCCCLGP